MSSRVLSTMICSADEKYIRTICISCDGYVFSFGENSKRNNEQKEIVLEVLPKQIPQLQNIISIACSDHVMCLDMDGNVFTFGSNSCGQLGIGMEINHTHKVHRIEQIPPIKQVSCGVTFSMCLSHSGDLYSFGASENGLLGLDGDDDCYTPKKIDSLKEVDFVECGGYHTICKTLNNEVYAWGENDNGQLGIDDTDDQYIPVKCTKRIEDIVDIKCGFVHTLILTTNQEVYSCGFNYFGQLGREVADDYSPTFQKIPSLSEIIRIECGDYHSICIDIQGMLYIFGNNDYGQLGLGDNDNNNRYEPIKHPSLSNIIDVSSRGVNTFVKISNNEIYAFGCKLGIKKEKNFRQCTPVRVFEDNEDIWCSNIHNKSKAKSARK